MYPAKPDLKSKEGTKLSKLSMIPVELLKKQETLRAVPTK